MHLYVSALDHCFFSPLQDIFAKHSQLQLRFPTNLSNQALTVLAGALEAKKNENPDLEKARRASTARWPSRGQVRTRIHHQEANGRVGTRFVIVPFCFVWEIWESCTKSVRYRRAHTNRYLRLAS